MGGSGIAEDKFAGVLQLVTEIIPTGLQEGIVRVVTKHRVIRPRIEVVII